jgi:ABC-type antimicrobial peptide transport system permease subunit
MKLSALGLGVGLIAALVLTRSMTTMLVGIQPTDLPTYATIVVLFIAIALVACSLPARRAARMDPLTALRSE